MGHYALCHYKDFLSNIMYSLRILNCRAHSIFWSLIEAEVCQCVSVFLNYIHKQWIFSFPTSHSFFVYLLYYYGDIASVTAVYSVAFAL